MTPYYQQNINAVFRIIKTFVADGFAFRNIVCNNKLLYKKMKSAAFLRRLSFMTC